MIAKRKLAALFSFGMFSSLSMQLAPSQAESAIVSRLDPSSKPLVIAHRGASGYRPEHTLQAYELAIDMGADFIEPDLVSTKDGELVARHENNISGTTNVATHKEFAGKKCSKSIDGKIEEGWFTEDFTAAELRTLKARERLPQVRQRNTIYNDIYQIPTFQEILDLVKRKEKELNRRIGIYPEVKHPSYFNSVSLPTDQKIIDTLHKNGYIESSAPIFIQCFEPGTLRKLRTKTKLKLVLLIDETGQPYDWTLDKDNRSYADMLTDQGLKSIAEFADGIGPNKNLIYPRNNDSSISATSDLVARAHKFGLQVHPWTFRNENQFLPKQLRKGDEKTADKSDDKSACSEGLYGDAIAEYKLFYDAGVDGVFSESPDTAIEARARL